MVYFYKLIMILALFSLQACNTVEGIGADIKGTGRTIEQSAAEAHHDLHHDHPCCHVCHKPVRSR